MIFAKAAVAADHRLASAAGVEVLRAGGNAVDAAIATSFALSVVRPYSCGIGGGGFMLIAMRDGRATCVNYRDCAPRAMREDFFANDSDPFASLRGGKSIAVPGHVAGMLHALHKYGTLPIASVLAPAMRLAREGFEADAHYESSAKEVMAWLAAQPGRRERFGMLWEAFLARGDVRAGTRIRLAGQERVFASIAQHGRAGFYEGDVARAMVHAAQRDGGVLSPDDLREFRVQEHAPLVTQWAGRRVLSAPPPSSGGIVLAQVFAMLESRSGDLRRIARDEGHNSAAYAHLVCEALKHAFADRARYLGDADFVSLPLDDMLSPQRLRDTAAKIDLARTQPHASYGVAEPLRDDHGTSHLCVVDEAGNSVACTETINFEFGSLVGVDGYDFMLNDSIDDFVTRRGVANAFGLMHDGQNLPAPGKRPLSCMTPTVVQDADGSCFMLAGASGGPRIITGTLQAILNATLFDMNAESSVSTPRFHHQWSPDTLQLEPALLDSPLRESLHAKGHDVTKRSPIAAVQVIRKQPGGWEPASDPRKGGAPAGY
ncbi:MAG TPA: gamma-glutamyltransferase [Phycisphaerales bacterium]|nr:gamma-glutamyltransferase [Phycisphaerales bacterium]